MTESESKRNGEASAEDARLDTQLLHAAVEGELDAEAAAAFEARLAEDPELARLVADLRSQRATLRGLPAVEPPASALAGAGPRLERAVLLDEPVDAEAARVRRAPPRRNAGLFPVKWLAAAAALAGVVVLGLFAAGGGDDRPTLADLADRVRVAEPVEPEADRVEAPAAAEAAPAESPVLAALAEAPPAAAPASRASGVAGPSLERAAPVGLDAFLLPEDAAPAAAEPADQDAIGAFQVGLLDSLSRGRRGPAVPRWAEAEAYLGPLADR